ncbi:sodium:solute symporter family protein [Pseudoramibacter sp. HA2172]|uniref:sodium:solute symporter family protein n=1 Tax=Pseudoramibacter faecis TaxID=3108534 RepID=UPI002E7961A4|nr:sodium:solute symporter [Pseudoramibacter sp. HA2172]
MFLKIFLLAAFFAVMIGVGIHCGRHAVSVNGFVLGGRSVGPWLTAFSFGTSYFSAVIFVGYAGQFGWKFGVASTWIGIGNALLGSLLAWVVLGRRTRIMTQHFGAATMPQFFGERFGSPSLKIAASVITFVFMIPYTASLYNGLSRLFGMAFHIDYVVCIVLMAALTAVYVIAGGYMATAINDFIQGIIMLFGIAAVVSAALGANGGFHAAIISLSRVKDAAAAPGQLGAFTSFFGPDPPGLLAVILLTSLGTWGLPQMVGKFYAIDSEHSINKGMVISTLFAFVVAGGSYFLGGFGRLYADRVNVAANGFDAIVPAMLAGLPDVLIAVVVILVLSASMSTLSSLVIASSSTLTLDLIRDVCFPDMEEERQVLVLRLFIVVFITISAVIATIQYKSAVTFIAQLMGISWGAMAGAFLAPFLYGLYSRRVTAASTWVSFIFAVGLMIATLLAPQWLPAFLRSPIQAGVFAMVAGLVLVPVVSLFTKAPDAALVADAFAAYDERVSVPVRDDLG